MLVADSYRNLHSASFAHQRLGDELSKFETYLAVPFFFILDVIVNKLCNICLIIRCPDFHVWSTTKSVFDI